MASSRKSQLSPRLGKRIAVALSGGLDSVVLLDTVFKAQANNKSSAIYVFHIHHGLQKQADDWLIFCEKLAKKYQVHFDFRLLHLKGEEQGNVEARARAERYEALADLCAEYGIEDLLLAHHQNDQAETTLLQLLRGAGVAGLAGMPASRELNAREGKVTLWRPLLGQSRKDLEAYAKEHKLKWIEDPSNQDAKYRRNAIRKSIIPALEKIQPEAIANLARSAGLLGEAQGLLDRLAIHDGKTILLKNGVGHQQLLGLAQNDLPAANNVLRYWLKANGLTMPSQERLAAWWRDLQAVKAGAQLEWAHDQSIIRLWRGILQVEDAKGGEWVFKTIPSSSKAPGLPSQWIRDAQKNGLITQKERSGSEKIQIKANTPRKTLKNLFQEGDIPPWERKAPLLYINGDLIAVAGVGLSYPHMVHSGPRVRPEWQQKA
ncbi:tRNA lysidine(34) synthetase TilS [Polynucleobacter sp. MWH-Berg-3C6]|uniref:tRNA lysidine(34) synthetase TilS n=1 Tax=Polynucleobacter sp. MWH-Berg-3C6 TaxID=1855882 RepID=UPI001C0AE833|nr:tRNA lysidine(34) synthetase TilS [Polynucleobacter sp. MWH-Berg-3C6]MBU3550453.1 tRNA lysidine(34) synthetase TilS [Polynucleobacter sp. MWH-Berg-3C6]